jgi:hypothetical protein
VAVSRNIALLRRALAAHLRESNDVRKRLGARLEDESVSPGDLPAEIRTLRKLASGEAALAQSLLRELGKDLGVPEARPMRDRTLDLLEDTGLPARAGLLAAHLEVREGMPVDVRRFGALRRYEAQARPRQRAAPSTLITPALDSDGFVYSAFMTRSSWPLDQRVIISDDHARLLEIRELLLILDEIDAGGPLVDESSKKRLAHHARRLLDASDLRPGFEADWREEVRERGTFAIGFLRAQLKPEQAVRKAASRLTKTLSPHEQLWGRQPTEP